jgi:hypothetical protein
LCGRFVYAGATRIQKGQKELGLFRVDVETDEQRFFSLGPAEDSGQTQTGAEQSLEPSLSPDGKWLAISGILLRKQTQGRPTALVLFDLTDPNAAVEMIALPPIPAGPVGGS